LPEIKRGANNRGANKSELRLLNDAVNKHERGDVALMKTLCRLNYNERMVIKLKYEQTYDTVKKIFNILLNVQKLLIERIFFGFENLY
jgi:hypothetical protein